MTTSALFRALAAFLLLASFSAMAQEPTAGIYSVRTPVNTSVNVPYSTVIVPGDGQNTVIVLTPPANGIVVAPSPISGGAQVFAYTPNTAYVGLDEFLYKVTDGTGDVSFGIISFNVGNVTAIAGDDNLVVPTPGESLLDVFFNDTGFADPVTFSIIQQPAHGTMRIDAPGPLWQSLIGVYYTPVPGYAGADQLRYQIGDGIDLDTATVNLIVSPDTDGDEILDYFDNCDAVVNPNQEDGDGDGVGDACDNCGLVVNPGQQDNEQDGLGDACDSDDDNDAVVDTSDNCVFVANANQLNADGDRYGNICDADLNNSNLTTATDFNLLRSVINRASTYSPLAAAADMNGSGLVTSTDFNLLRARLNTAPGPSGLPP